MDITHSDTTAQAEALATVATTDSAFAAALMTHGARLFSWRQTGTGVEWTIDRVPGDAIEAYKSGSDGFREYSRNRIMLSDMAKSLCRQNPKP